MRLLTILLMLCFAGTATAQTAQERTQLDRALQRGRLIFELDRAAWVTTDDVRQRLPSDDRGAVRGWTVERDGGGYAVTYYAGEGDARAAVYRGRVENRRVVSREVFPANARPPLTAVQRRLADARRAVRLMNQRPCTNAPFNTVVIPPETAGGPAEVYALTSQTDSNSYPFGGHFLGTISTTGELLSRRAFTRACLNMLPQPPRGSQPAGLIVSHLLDPTPTEIHVFMSIWMGLPVYVLTGDRTWEVTGDGIRLIERSSR